MNRYTMIDNALLAGLSQAARGNERRRQPYLLHTHQDESCQRLLNAIEPGSYVQPHCHLAAGRDETLLVLSGSVGVLLFKADSQVEAVRVMSPRNGSNGIHIPAGVFHSIVALSPGSVLFECKAGPHAALTEQERAWWAPQEGASGWQDYLAQMLGYFQHK